MVEWLRAFKAHVLDYLWMPFSSDRFCAALGHAPEHLESQLDGQQFMRTHRSTTVNVDRIQQMQSWFNGEAVVLRHNGTGLTFSCGYRDAIQTRLGKPL